MTAGRPSISVVVPTHEGAAYIHHTLRSVLSQTELPAEIVLVDDCSHDDTVTTVYDLARTAPIPIRVVRLARNSGGPAHPINVGVEAATSQLIAVLEQDDQMTPTRLARSLAAAEAIPGAGLICGRVRLHSPGGDVREDLWWDGHRQFDGLPLTPVADGVYSADSEAVISSLLWRNFVFTNSNAVFSRAVWQRVGGFDRRFPICSDLDFNLKVARLGPFAVIDDVVCNYFQRDDSLYNSNRAAEGGYSPALSEASLIRLQHALRAYGPATDVGRDWYRQGWRMLLSNGKHLRWSRAAHIGRVLCSTRGAPRYAASLAVRAITSWRRGRAGSR